MMHEYDFCERCGHDAGHHEREFDTYGIVGEWWWQNVTRRIMEIRARLRRCPDCNERGPTCECLPF